MDGMTSTRAIREYEDIHNIARCRIIALTGLASASARLEALSSGVDQFITKPLNFKLLRSLLEKENEKTRHVIETRDIKESGGKEKVEERIFLERQKDKDNIPQQEAEMSQSEPEPGMSERQQDSAKIEPQREADKTEHYEVIRNPEARQDLGQVEPYSQTTKTELQEEVEKREPQQSIEKSQEH
jgi:response regulator RpfG family c-di-GMP phosphodiesterase